MVVAHLLVGSSIGGFPVKAEELVDFMPVERTAEIEEIVEPVAENFGSGDEKDNFVEMDTTVPKRIETVENNVEEDDGISEEPFPLEPEETPVPIPTEEAEIEFTGEHQKVLYVYGNGSADIYKATDGNWYDDFGRCYIFQGDGYWIHAETGAIWADLETLSIPPEQNATSEVAVTDQEAISFGTLYLGPDGVWRNEAGGIYTNNGDNTFRDVDGEVWYTVSEE